jgi:hemerythrin superfamily protein
MTRMDSMLSHGSGKLRKARATLQGLAGVFRVLAEQHGELVMLLRRAQASNEKFLELWPSIRIALIAHERAEMHEVYPTLRANPATRSLAEHHDVEATGMERLVEEIDDPYLDPQARALSFEVLVDRVMRHAEDEETRIFPQAQQALGREAVEAMESGFLATKQEIERAH